MKVILISLVVSITLTMLIFFLGKTINKKMLFDREFQSPFECGFSSDFELRIPFSLHFFILAMVFLIFDVELILLFPFLVESWMNYSITSSLILFLFIMLLMLGVFNEWNQNVLEWTK